MNSNEGIPAWKGKYNYDDGRYDEQISKLRNNGGDIIISFGGGSGKEMAGFITDVDELQKAYQKVIDRFNLTWIDLDIEGDISRDDVVTERRNKALVGIQKNNPNLTISYCLSADPRGLASKSKKILADAVKQGVRVDVVNVMAMDYGSRIVSDPDGKLGYYAIKTAKESKKNLEELGLPDTKIGITAMIGVNGVPTEIFRMPDAKELLEWANETEWVRLLSIWSLNRDNGDDSEGKEASSRNSGISQELFEFTNLFKEYNDESKNNNITTSEPVIEEKPTTTPEPVIEQKPTTTPEPGITPVNVNLALKKNTTCSSVEKSKYDAKNAVDGSKSTRWASEEYKSNPEWIQVDLGNIYDINKVKIKWESAYAKAYQVQVSTDGENYTTVADITKNKKKDITHEFNTIEARYIKIYCTQKATKYGYSIYELEVYNKN